jgi:SulP family sulfate permease
VVALALIPEAIAFSIIAGVDPMVGLYASFIIAVVAVTTAMINEAYKPTIGSTPAIIENAIASGIKAKAY